MTLVVSKGPVLVTVPDVVGQQLPQARGHPRGRRVQGHRARALGGFFGTVRLQDPSGGSKAPKGSTVTADDRLTRRDRPGRARPARDAPARLRHGGVGLDVLPHPRPRRARAAGRLPRGAVRHRRGGDVRAVPPPDPRADPARAEGRRGARGALRGGPGAADHRPAAHRRVGVGLHHRHLRRADPGARRGAAARPDRAGDLVRRRAGDRWGWPCCRCRASRWASARR